MIYSPKYTYQIRNFDQPRLPSESRRSSLIGKKKFPRFVVSFSFFLQEISLPNASPSRKTLSRGDRFARFSPCDRVQFRNSPSPRLGCRKSGHFFSSFSFPFRRLKFYRPIRSVERRGEVSPGYLTTIYFRIERESGSLPRPSLLTIK